MELNTYLLPLRRWWWLMVLTTSVAAGSSYWATSQQLPLYQSTTTLLIGRTIEDPNPSSGEIVLGQQLATTYADIAMREQVRNATMEALSLEWLPQYTAQALPNSQILEIAVVDTNPVRAQAVAAELANQLIRQSPTSSSPEEQERLQFIDEQLNKIQVQIQATEGEIEALQTLLGDLTSALQIQETETQIAALQSKLTTLQTNYANLVANTQQGASNILTILEPANLPTQPINQNSMLTITLASAIGFSLAAGAAFVLEYLDKSIKTPEEAIDVFENPVVGYIPVIPEEKMGRPYVAVHPRSAIAEAFRALRINIEFASSEHPLKSLFVTSADPAAGKTSVIVNLAIMMAQGGHQILLLDADLRRPNIHGYLGVSNSEGLSTVLTGELDFQDAIRVWEPGNLSVITAGSPPLNPGELLSSARMSEMIAEAEKEFDFVLIDGPPFLVTDASILASRVNGVLIVIQPGRTHRDSAHTIREQVEIAGARTVGVVFNRIPRRNLNYYGKYWYHAPQYKSSYIQADGQHKLSRRRLKEHDTIPAVIAGSRGRQPNLTTEFGDTKREQLGTGPFVEDPVHGENGNMEPKEPPKPPKARAVLRWKDIAGKRQKLVLREGDTILIGRDRINDVIIHNRHVSRRHAVITWRNDLFEIADLGSTNGTFVNGEAAERPIELEDGDRILLFDIEILYKKFKTIEQQ